MQQRTCALPPTPRTSRASWLPFALVALAAATALAGDRAAKPHGGKSVATDRRVAITFDDLPEVTASPRPDSDHLAVMRATTARLLLTLRAHRAPAIGFVNEAKLQAGGEIPARIALLRMWLDAGMTLGNHTYSHLNLHDTPLAQYENDVLRGEKVTRPLLRA